ncbi:MAG: superinfection immunity protein [Planctomycetaceae bacterium]|nr:superinfection immunity protein [Planctomycetaceae bacterium]
MIVLFMVLAIWSVPLVAYFAPSVLAYRRKHPSFRWFLAVNAFAGWTVVVWAILLVATLRFTPEESHAIRQRS